MGLSPGARLLAELSLRSNQKELLPEVTVATFMVHDPQRGIFPPIDLQAFLKNMICLQALSIKRLSRKCDPSD